MTRSQTAYLRLLKRVNKKVGAAGRAYIRDPETFQQIAQATHPEAAARIIAEEETGAPAFMDPKQTGDDDNPLELLIWEAYLGTRALMRTDEGPIDLQSDDLWPVFRQALSEILKQEEKKQNGPFFQISQNRAINALAVLRNEDIVKDKLGGAHATIKGRNGSSTGDISFKFTSRTDGSLVEWNTTTAILLIFLLEDYASTKRQSVRISLKEYAAKRGIKAKDLKDFQEDTGRALDNLYAVSSMRYYEKIGGKWTASGGQGLCGGDHYVARGQIIWNWNTSLLPELDVLAPSDLPEEIYKVDVRTNQFDIIFYIARNYRMNEGRKRQSRIKVSTLLQNLPGIPSIEKVRAQRQSARSKIVKPIIRDLDAFDCFSWDFIDAAGNIVPDPENLSYEDFVKGFFDIDYSDWPNHTQRIESREKREKKAAKAKKAVQKTRGENDAEEQGETVQKRRD